jgi:peptide/nickel transport system ATP-binding protein
MLLLDAQGVSVRFGAQRAVDAIDLAIAAGETLGLVGESGSGKSLTALALAGLLPIAAQAEGRIILAGAELAADQPRAWDGLRGRRIGFVFQDPFASFDPLIRVGAQIAAACHAPRPAARERTLSLLADCGFQDPATIAAAYPHQLSGGQLQRASLAAALAGAPAVLIADEPTTALDVTVQAQVLDLLRRLRLRHAMALLFISHDLAVVGRIADRVAVMKDGRIVETGTVGRILASPAHPYTRQLIAARPAGRIGPAAPAATTTALQATALGFRFAPRRPGEAATTALSDLSLDLPAGACLGLVGESGSGKSTFGRLAVGLLRPSTGAIRVFGMDPAAQATARRRARQVQMVFQDAAGSLNPRRTIRDSLIEPLALHAIGSGAERRDRAAALLDEVGLAPEHLARYPHELSGGQRQRVAIARALALDPALLVCDEPVTALDMTIQAQILRLLARIRAKRSLTMIFISHDIAAIETLADIVAVLHRGRLVEQGPAARVLAAPVADYTRALLAAVPRLGHRADMAAVL